MNNQQYERISKNDEGNIGGTLSNSVDCNMENGLNEQIGGVA